MLDGKLASAGVLIKTFSAKKLFSKMPLSGIMTSHLTSFTVYVCVSHAIKHLPISIQDT